MKPPRHIAADLARQNCNQQPNNAWTTHPQRSLLRRLPGPFAGGQVWPTSTPTYRTILFLDTGAQRDRVQDHRSCALYLRSLQASEQVPPIDPETLPDNFPHDVHLEAMKMSVPSTSQPAPAPAFQTNKCSPTLQQHVKANPATSVAWEGLVQNWIGSKRSARDGVAQSEPE